MKWNGSHHSKSQMLGRHINHCEDSLTAAIFTHLLHLPAELFWKILRSACYEFDQLPDQPGELVKVDYWPKWDATGTHPNQYYVEPDVFIRFRTFDLIVEAKRWDRPMQDQEQWQRELIAWSNEYGEAQRFVKMIALGGIHTTTCGMIFHEWQSSEFGVPLNHLFKCPVFMCRWRRLIEECQKLKRTLCAEATRSSL